MEALAERARQALHMGDPAFHATALEAEHRALAEAAAFAHQVTPLERALDKWGGHTDELLRAAGTFLQAAPRPRHFVQSDPTDKTTLSALPPSLPAEYEPLNDHALMRTLAGETPLAVGGMLARGLREPLQLWLAAHEAAKERLSGLERLRPQFDSARRALHAASRAEGAGELGTPAHFHLIKEEEAHQPVMRQFGAERGALSRHLLWLSEQAAALKAAVALGLARAHQAADDGVLLPPPGLMMEFPLELMERPDYLAKHPAPPPASAEAASAAAAAAVEAAVAAAHAAAPVGSAEPQLVMLEQGGPVGMPPIGGAVAAGAATGVLFVPPGTLGAATEAAAGALMAAEAQAQMAEGSGESSGAVPASMAELRHEDLKFREHRVLTSPTGGMASARLMRLVSSRQRRAALHARWQDFARRALLHERTKGLPEHARDQMMDMRRRAGMTGGFLMTPQAAPQLQWEARKRLPGGGPLQFLRDTLLGPRAMERENVGVSGMAAAAHDQAAAGGFAEGPATTAATPPLESDTLPTSVAASEAAYTPPPIVGVPTPAAGTPAAALGSGGSGSAAAPPADHAAAAAEQMHAVAEHGTGGATLTGALHSPSKGTGALAFVRDTLLGPRVTPEEAGASSAAPHLPHHADRHRGHGMLAEPEQRHTLPGGGPGAFIRDTLVGQGHATAATAAAAQPPPPGIATAAGLRYSHPHAHERFAARHEGHGAVAGPVAVGGAAAPGGGPLGFVKETLIGPQPQGSDEDTPRPRAHEGPAAPAHFNAQPRTAAAAREQVHEEGALRGVEPLAAAEAAAASLADEPATPALGVPPGATLAGTIAALAAQETTQLPVVGVPGFVGGGTTAADAMGVPAPGAAPVLSAAEPAPIAMEEGHGFMSMPATPPQQHIAPMDVLHGAGEATPAEIATAMPAAPDLPFRPAGGDVTDDVITIGTIAVPEPSAEGAGAGAGGEYVVGVTVESLMADLAGTGGAVSDITAVGVPVEGAQEEAGYEDVMGVGTGAGAGAGVGEEAVAEVTTTVTTVTSTTTTTTVLVAEDVVPAPIAAAVGGEPELHLTPLLEGLPQVGAGAGEGGGGEAASREGAGEAVEAREVAVEVGEQMVEEPAAGPGAEVGATAGEGGVAEGGGGGITASIEKMIVEEIVGKRGEGGVGATAPEPAGAEEVM